MRAKRWCHRLVLVPLVLAAISFGGCGGGDAEDERREASARDAVKTLYEAMQERDAARVCGFLTPQARRAFVALAAPGEGLDCSQVFEDAFKRASTPPVSDVAIRRLSLLPEERAKATVSVDGRLLGIRMVEADGTWRFSSLGRWE